jgi:dTMP kinase
MISKLMKLICLEGCSGTGKTTHHKLLSDNYSETNIRYLSVVEKFYEPFKSVVNEWHRLKGPAVPFTEGDVRGFARARSESYFKNFAKLENELDLILFDRYFYTSAVYQKNSGLTPNEILQINIDYGAPVPDITFLFDSESNIAFKRSENRNQKTGGKPLFSTSPEKIDEIRKEYLDLLESRDEIMLVNADAPIDQIHSILTHEIDKLL